MFSPMNRRNGRELLRFVTDSGSRCMTSIFATNRKDSFVIVPSVQAIVMTEHRPSTGVSKRADDLRGMVRS